jgi:FKBP-type peptidyl-prolyl cis-trans isomerase
MNKNFLISLLIVALFAVGVYFVVKNAPERENININETSTETMNTENSDMGMTSPEMIIKKEGTGEKTAQAGDTISVVYTGFFQNGEIFDSNVDSGQNFEFTLSSGQVISGWDIGLVGMKVGEVRMLTLPPEFAYGSNAVGPIPANSTLVFEVELKEIK